MLIGIAVFVATLVAMEGFAHLMHKYVMHGPLWFLHRSHHEPKHDHLELNDLFGIVFAIPSVVLIWFGTHGHPLLLAAGAGMAGYGVVYWGFHDVLVHRRIPHTWLPKGGYLRRIVQAHHVHHATRTRDGAESFGFLYSPDFSRKDRSATE